MQTATLISLLSQGNAGLRTAPETRQRHALMVNVLALSCSVGLFFYAWGVANTVFEQPFIAGYFVKALSGIAIFVVAIRVWGDLLTSRLGPVQWGEVAARLSLLGAAIWVWIDYTATGTNASQHVPENGLACTSGILLLAMPIWLALAWQARQCLPTRLRFTGAASGAVAVGFAIPLFSLGCAENAPSYIVLWFGLAIAIAIAIGALCTPRLIRW